MASFVVSQARTVGSSATKVQDNMGPSPRSHSGSPRRHRVQPLPAFLAREAWVPGVSLGGTLDGAGLTRLCEQQGAAPGSIWLQILVLLSTDTFSGHQDSRFPKILENLRLQKRGTGGVDTAAVGGIFDISNLDRLGKSEVGARQSWGGRFWNVSA